MSAKDGHISPEGENSLLGRSARRSLTVAGWLVHLVGRTGSRSPSGTRVSPRFGGGWCGALGDRELFYFAKVPFPPCGLYLVSRQAGHALPRALKAASVVVSSRGRPSRSHLGGGGFPAGCLPRLTKSTFRPVPALAESQACLAPAGPTTCWPIVESQGEPGEIKQSPISALFP